MVAHIYIYISIIYIVETHNSDQRTSEHSHAKHAYTQVTKHTHNSTKKTILQLGVGILMESDCV